MAISSPDERYDPSKRRFIKTTAVAAYVGPLIVSLPVRATFADTGSGYASTNYPSECGDPMGPFGNGYGGGACGPNYSSVVYETDSTR